VDGVLTVDLAVEEAEDFSALLRKTGIDSIFLLAPTTESERLDAIARLASGYLYYVSLKGVTGASTLDVAQVRERLADIRKHTDIPVAVGFGIRDPATARQVAAIADAVVVGSSLVAEVERCAASPQDLPQALQRKVAELRAAIDSIE
jgi:tryptophan synthase alpha chain